MGSTDARLLVVDDDPFSLDSIKCTLRPGSGRNSLQRKLFLIILDVMMPVMSGYKTATLILEESSNQDTPIIF